MSDAVEGLVCAIEQSYIERGVQTFTVRLDDEAAFGVIFRLNEGVLVLDVIADPDGARVAVLAHGSDALPKDLFVVESGMGSALIAVT